MTSPLIVYLPNWEPVDEETEPLRDLEARLGWESARLERLDLAKLPPPPVLREAARSFALPVILDLRRFETETNRDVLNEPVLNEETFVCNKLSIVLGKKCLQY